MIRRIICRWRGHNWVVSPLSNRYRRCSRCGAEQVWYDHLNSWSRSEPWGG